MEQSMEDHTEGDKFIPPHDEGTPHRHTFKPAIGHGSERELVQLIPAAQPTATPAEPANIIGESVTTSVIDSEES